MSETDVSLAVQGGRQILGVEVVPDDGNKIFKMDITNVVYALGRIDDVQHVTPAKAPELLTVFNQAYLELTDHSTKLMYQLTRASNEVDTVKARILIDKIPVLIEEKKLPSSKDIRDALIAADPEYQAVKTTFDRIECLLENLKGKQKSIEMAYSSVKKIIDGNNYNMASKAGARVLNGILDDSKTAGQVQRDPMFGEVRRYT
jgi:hypothetical protein